jgi:hypothetical protein
MSEARGTLVVARTTGPGTVREEKVEFTDLQGLLDACAAFADAVAFVRVQINGTSDGKPRRLVLDFGQFGRGGE